MSYGRAKTLGKAHLQDRVRASPLLLQLCFRRHVLNLLGAQHAVAYFNAPAPTGSGTELAGPASLQTYFKLTSKLTINAGIRWDFEPPRTERFNRQIFWDKDYPWDWQPRTGWTWDLAQQQAGVTGAAQPQWLSGFCGRAGITGTPEYPSRVFRESGE